MERKQGKITMNMIERTAKIDRLIEKIGGQFLLTVLIQKRIRELVQEKAAPKIQRSQDDYEYLVDLVLDEIEQGRIVLVDPEELEEE